MSVSQIGAGQVLGTATTIGGVAVLPLTGGSIFWMILPAAAIVCGILILVTLSITERIERKNASK